jgi:hypothetical protein
MKNGNVRRIVVVNESGSATSVLSFNDLFSLVAEEIGVLKELGRPTDNRIERDAA